MGSLVCGLWLVVAWCSGLLSVIFALWLVVGGVWFLVYGLLLVIFGLSSVLLGWCNAGLWAVRGGLLAVGGELWVLGCGMWVVGCGLWVVGCGMWVVGYAPSMVSLICGLWLVAAAVDCGQSSQVSSCKPVVPRKFFPGTFPKLISATFLRLSSGRCNTARTSPEPLIGTSPEPKANKTMDATSRMHNAYHAHYDPAGRGGVVGAKVPWGPTNAIH